MMLENERAAQLETIAAAGRARLAQMKDAIEEHGPGWLEDLELYRTFVRVLRASYPSFLGGMHGMTRAALTVLPFRVKWKVKDGVFNNWGDHSWLESGQGDIRLVLDPATPDVLSGPQLLVLQKKREEDRFTLATHFPRSFMYADSPLPESSPLLREWQNEARVIAGAYRDLQHEMRGEA